MIGIFQPIIEYSQHTCAFLILRYQRRVYRVQIYGNASRVHRSARITRYSVLILHIKDIIFIIYIYIYIYSIAVTVTCADKS